MSVSLVIPVRDEAGNISELLSSIRAQTRPPDEIVFVDGGSRDDTVRQLRTAAKQDRRIRVIESDNASPGRGRNLGICAASFDSIALTDAGIRLDPRWLEALLAAWDQDREVDIVFGAYAPITETFFESCAATAYVEPPHLTPSGLMRGPSIASCLLKPSVWKAVGGFPDLRATEDLIFIERIRQQKHHIAWAPEALVWWRLRPSLKETYRRFELYSRHNVWAGRERYWHYGVARQYIGAGVLLGLAMIQSPWWAALLGCAAAARVARAIWRHRQGHNLLWLLNPARFALVGVILGAIDAATLVGWARAKSQPNPVLDLSGSSKQ